MDNFIKEIGAFFDRDLKQLATEVEMVPEEYIWRPVAGITNSCGILAQHLVGNLNYYVGTCLGDTGYERNRNREFTNTGLPKSQLVGDIRDTAEMVPAVLNDLTTDELAEPYPYYTKKNYTVGQYLIHLYGHFNYHLGQVNYLRRILAEEDV